MYFRPLIIFLLISGTSFAQWTNMNTGINDHLTDVVMNGNDGLVCGYSGVYYTQSGGVGPTSWQEISSFTVPSDGLVYERSRFEHCAQGSNPDEVMICGRDTVNNQAVIFQVSLTTMTAELEYTGTVGSGLNYITFSTSASEYFAVGTNGLIVKLTSSSSPVLQPTSIADDLNCMVFLGNKFALGMDGKRAVGQNNGSSLSLSVIETLINYDIEDLTWNNTNFYDGVGSHFFNFNQIGGIIGFVNSTFSFLDYRAIEPVGSFHFAATNEGIFRRNTNSTLSEFQPSSDGYSINEFHRDNSNGTLYASGMNGVLLSTTNNGGTPLPYVNITGQGGCLNAWVSVQGEVGPSSSCQWFVDGIPANTSCGATVLNSSTLGIQQVMLIASKGGLSDTAYMDVHIVDTPTVNFATTITDSILCKAEWTSLILDSSATDVSYQLFDVGATQAFSNQFNGTGSSITLNTDVLTATGNYVVQAQSTLANCTANFTDTLHIVVEQTEALYHSTGWNEETNEPVLFLNNSLDASTYQWTFSPNASLPTSTQFEPEVSFGSAGNTNVELIASSSNGCHDTISGSGPNIYVLPTIEDSCWINQKNGADQQWIGSYYEDISDMVPTSDGFLAVGQYSHDTLESQLGQDYILPGHGGYLAKYNFNGAIDWLVHMPQTSPTFSQQSLFENIAVDGDGNIYLTSNTYGSMLHSNSGEMISLQGPHTLIKLDSLGRFQWYNRFNGIARSVVVDSDGNVVLRTGTNSPNSFFHASANGTVNSFNWSTTGVDYMLLKISPQGQYINHLRHDAWGTAGENDIQVDADNYIYTIGSYRNTLRIYDSANVQLTSQPGFSNDESIYISKFDPNLNHLWTTTIKKGASNNWGDLYTYDLLIDTTTSNLYLSGRATNSLAPLEWYAYSTNGNVDTVYLTGLLITSYDSSGVHRWTGGTDASVFSRGMSMFFEDSLLYLSGIVDCDGCQLFGTGQNVIDYSGTQQDMFVTAFDTTGALQMLYKSGESQINLLSGDPMIRGLFKKNGLYYTNRNAQAQTGVTLDLEQYGDTVYFNTYNGRIGWIHKFSPDCAIQINASHLVQQAVNVCYNGDYVLADGSTLTNITTNLLDTTVLLGTGNVDTTFITNINVLAQIGTSFTSDVCAGDNYTFPDGTIYTNIQADTSYTIVYNSFTGCDSLVTYNVNVVDVHTGVQINNSDFVAIQAGGLYTWIECNSGTPVTSTTSQQWFTPLSSGDYAVAIEYNGCPDTSACVNFELIEADHCEGNDYTFVNGVTQQGLSNDTIVYLTIAADSLLSESISILPVSEETIQQMICLGSDFTYSDGTIQTNIQQNTQYTSIFTGLNGCDSTITEVVTVQSIPPTNNSINLCYGESHTFQDGNTLTLYADTVYTSNLTSQLGCDSNFVTTVLVAPEIVATISETNGVLESVLTGSSYAWLDCDNGFQYPQQTGFAQTYVPVVNGNYAVLVTQNGCSDTSDCFLVDYVGLTTSTLHTISVVPNPSSGTFKLTGENISGTTITVSDLSSRKILSENLKSSEYIINLENVATGSYLLKIEKEGVPYANFTLLKQ